MIGAQDSSRLDQLHRSIIMCWYKPSHFQGEGLDGVRIRPWQQDGIAPQCAVPDLYFDQVAQTSFDEDNQIQYQGRRIQFDGESKHLNFTDAHFARNYGWIFTSIQKTEPGFVEKR